MQPLSAADETYRDVRDWVAAWGREVAAVDLTAARTRMSPDIVAFGTRADVVHGIDALHDEQWRPVWPSIDNFHFLLDDLVVLASADRSQAVAVVAWGSRGVSPAGEPFDRPGRATIVLARPAATGPWFGTHTHFSLVPGVPPSSHGSDRR